MTYKNKSKTEKLLVAFKTSGSSDCICCHILKIKLERLRAEYEPLVEHIEKRKTNGEDYQKPLGYLQKTGNKLRAIKEALHEIENAKYLLDNLFKVEIKGKTFYRLNKNRDRRSSCGRKIKYSSMNDAQQAAIEIAERLGDEMEGYKCRHCDFFHVGHKISP